MRVLPSRIHVYAPDEDTAFIDGGDWTDALVSVRCKRFNPPLSNAVDLEFARAWTFDMEKTDSIFCRDCFNFVLKAQFDHISALYKASQDKVRA